MAKLLGIDIGTSGCKAVLIDESGTVLGQSSAEYPLSIPKPLWSEQNPNDWWDGAQACFRELDFEPPDAIGLTGQMHGSVFLDDCGEVIRPALLWNDQRTSAECAEIEAAVGPERLREITCNPMLTGFQLPKLIWLRNHEPENFARVRSILLPKDFIRFKLTGVKATEVSDASGVGALDVPARKWSEEIFNHLNLDPSLFPPVVESSQAASQTDVGIPVVGGGGDQAAGAVGTGAVEEGVVSVSLGTSGVVFTALDRPQADPSGAAHTFCHANGRWHAMGVMLSCGGALRWFRDLMQASAYDELGRLAETAPAGCEGLTFLPYLTGERCPHNDPFAKAAFAGLTLGHTQAHLARSVFEGVSFGLRDGLGLLLKMGAKAGDIRVTGGGARSPFWMEMLADIFELPCSTLEVDEGPAFGAAILAGVGIGVWPNVETACRQVIRKKRRFEPRQPLYDGAYARFLSLYPALKVWNRT